MIEHDTQTNETHVFCDRCGVELTENVYVLVSGDSLCENCFNNSYRIEPVEQYIEENI